MDKEQLQQKIAEYFEKLPREAQDVFSSMGWMETLKNIATKYNLNEDQIELLGTETTLVLLSIVHIEEYQKNIKTGLGLPEEILKEINTEIDNNILKTIKGQLVETFESNVLTLKLDPIFSTLPKNVQEAIASSNWKEKLYNIAEKYKLPIPQMDVLEEITIKVMKDEIHPDKYESELASKITIAKEDISNLVNDVNEDILKNIRELLKTHWNEEEKKEEIPIPPYAKTETKVEILKVEETPKPVLPIIETTPLPPQNIIEEKLKSATVSDHTISDYSSPKISSPSPEASENNSNPSPKSFDPYREVF